MQSSFVLFWRGPQIRARSRVVQQLRAIAAQAAARDDEEKPVTRKSA